MERRKEPRLSVKQPVTLTILSAGGSQLIEGCVTDISDSGLRVRTQVSLPCGTPVKIDANNTLMLGEIRRCVHAEGGYIAGIQLTCKLSSFLDLERLNQALIEERRDPADVAPAAPQVSRR